MASFLLSYHVLGPYLSLDLECTPHCTWGGIPIQSGLQRWPMECQFSHFLVCDLEKVT